VQWWFIHLIALTDHDWAALMWGLPLVPGGLYECGQVLAQGQFSPRRQRVSRMKGG